MRLGGLANLAAVFAMTSVARAQAPTILFDGRDLDIHAAADAPGTIRVEGPDLVPILWRRGDTHEARLPVLLIPGAGESAVVNVGEHFETIVTARCPRVAIDAHAYDHVANWRPTSAMADRRTTLLLATGFSVSLLMAALLKRGRAAAIVGVAAAWAIGLSVAANRRPTLIVRDETDGSRWFLATEAQTLRVPIRHGEPWVPVVESVGQLKTLSPRIEVDGDVSTLELNLPAGRKIAFRLSS